MRLTIDHRSHYQFDRPVAGGLQQLRLTPLTEAGLTVHHWALDLDGGKVEAQYCDHHGNGVTLVSLSAGTRDLIVRGHGLVETEDRIGVVGGHFSPLPLWYYLEPSAATRAGPRIRGLAAAHPAATDTVGTLHALSESIRAAVAYRSGTTGIATTAEDAAAAGEGVCQDHAHVFVSAARLLGIPARYVSGYLMLNETVEQDASHAWTEAHVDGLGWVGFDISNGVSPDGRYVRLATGRDYRDAAPITGVSFGARDRSLNVTLAVALLPVEQ